MINGFALRILRFEGVGHVFLGLDPVGPCQRILIFTSRSRAGTRAFRGEVDGMDSIPEALHDVRPETKSQPPIYMRERTRNEKGGGGIRHFRLGARRGDPSRGSRRPSFPRYSSGFPLPLKKSGGFLWDLWSDSVVDGVLVRPCASFSGFSVDLNKPLVFQVGHLGEDYEDWVHRPIVTKEIPRFFANGFMECLTRTVWWVVPVIWLPVVFWCLTISIRMGNTLPQLVPLVLSGILLWTLIEYSLHRFLFHMKTKGYWGNTIHYLFHGCHHKYPMDGLRLVFPPAATAIICVLFWHLLHLLTAPSAAPAVFGGGLLGYVIYDCTHYYLHHGHPSKHPAKHLKIPYCSLWWFLFFPAYPK
ncbi:hypothetical protein C4D60_Mb02t11990 [Musa balbisiana]|uniref:Fatty acid hydroxylase domain-containing protein n=1 Tax=Musa balbisiana TaxID=52838 RepID=A0A4V4H2M0_MUSBA|nr:hypothetical protein C4D60_Mb02t11990 [Musa balbisiana]